MNILYIHTHDTGRYIEPYGYKVSTPNLMELAEEGTLFRKAFNTAPTCSPSRASLLTGQSPHVCGMLGLAHRGFSLNDNSKHLAQFLGRNGYETALCGIQHVAHDRKILGYNHYLGGENDDRQGFADDIANTESLVDYIKNYNSDKPFFISFGMRNTHLTFPEIADDINPDYIIPPFPFYDSPENREDWAGFMTSVQIVDNCVGKVLNALNEKGIEDDTLIIFTTDHGVPFARMKCNLYDTGTGVSLIIKLPEKFLPENKYRSKSCEAMVSHLDIYPTICELTGLEKPDWLEGNSMIPMLSGETDKVRDEVFGEVTFHAAYEPMRSIRTDRYKLIRIFSDHDNYVPANIDDCNSKDFLIEHNLLDHSRDKEMLFDLYLDPVERVNLIDDESYQEIYRDLSARLDDWMEKTDDPLLEGRVVRPAGAIVNKLSCLSPEEEDFVE